MKQTPQKTDSKRKKNTMCWVQNYVDVVLYGGQIYDCTHIQSIHPKMQLLGGQGGTIAAARAKKMGQKGNITCATELLMDYYPE